MLVSPVRKSSATIDPPLVAFALNPAGGSKLSAGDSVLGFLDSAIAPTAIATLHAAPTQSVPWKPISSISSSGTIDPPLVAFALNPAGGSMISAGDSVLGFLDSAIAPTAIATLHAARSEEH